MKTAVTLLSFVLAASAASAASAQDAGWYVRGEVGASFEGEVDGARSADTDSGFSLSAAVGRTIANNFRLEGELTYADADGSGQNSGDLRVLGGFLNGYYDVNSEGPWRPFVGAGLGLAKVDVDGGPASGDDTGFAWQLKAGLAYVFSERLTGEVAYRYLGVQDISTGAAMATRIDGDFSTQAVSVGLRYMLGY